MRFLTSLAILSFLLFVHQARAQESGIDSLRQPRLVLSYRYPSLVLAPPPALAAGGRLGTRTPPAVVAAAWARRVGDSLPRGLGAAPSADTSLVAALAPLGALPGRPPAPSERVFQGAGPGSLGQFASLGMDLSLRFELKADRFRNLQCNNFDRQQAISGCGGGFPTISPNPQYAIRSGGVVGRRLHVNVDFDSQREFDANNNLQVWYEGLQDEILQRVEVGNVSFEAPSSRFISAAIPANNFGIQATAQVGALTARGIYAQQKGNVVRDRVYTVGETTTQGLDRQLRDLDFEAGRFYFVVDPAALPGYPALDILNLPTTGLVDSLRVGSVQVYRARTTAGGGTVNQNLGGIRAVACGPGARAVDCAGERVGPFQWQILEAGKDYYVDPSGAWFALAVPSDPNDYLAVSYVPVGEEGCGPGTHCVGTYPLGDNPDSSVVDTLRLVYDPRPGVTDSSPSFRFEIRNAYRIGGSDISRQSVTLSLTVNQRERTANSGDTYLNVLGLALANDPNTFDEYNRLFPRDRDPQNGAPLRDYYVIFPTLRPFADSTLLAPGERNDSLYRTPRSLLAQQGPSSVFTLSYHAEVTAAGDRGTLSLGSFQIREGSERLYLGNRLLVAGADYTIDYAAGVVTFINPDSLFQGGAGTVRAQFEEKSQFVVAPTAIYGLAAKYDLGTTGAVNLMGLFQRQQSPFTRPQLGFEAASNFIGGVTTELHFRPDWLTRAVNALPGIHTAAPSFLNVSGEVALSRPSPNQAGQAYLEQFEGEAGRFISLNENAWHLGSMPSSARGATAFGVPATGFDPLDAAAITWQSLPCNYKVETQTCVPVQFTAQQIDPNIRLVGQTTSAEPVLWLMLKPDTVMGLANSTSGTPNWRRPGTGPNARATTRWRSITQTLSPSGLDLSRVEYLEFWVWEDNLRTARANGAAVLFDFGSTFEDALAFEPDSFTVTGGDTTYYGMRLAGAGRLDTEREPVTHSWSASIDDEGILGDRVFDILNATTHQIVDTLPVCSATVNGQIQTYAFGDLLSRCTRHNGALDTEDQDGDFLLDTLAGIKSREDFVRYVFPIGDERYFVRNGGMVPASPAAGGGASGWRLYRIPFRSDTLQQGEPNLRQVQTLRITILAPETAPPDQPDPQIYFGLSRVRLVGATWVKRAETPIPGIAGDRGTGSGEVVASVVSTENSDLGYVPPPGVFDQAGRQGADLQLTASQINERSLRLLARGLDVGQHAEAVMRFGTEENKNLLGYRKLRVWARGRGPGWEDGDLEFYIKVGKDEANFYMYHTPVRTGSWEPEVVVGLDRWLSLRARIEQDWLAGDPPGVGPGCPDSSIVHDDSAYVRCDGPYLVHIRDPGTGPPNLASVQELAAGMLRVRHSVFIDQAELWVDDIRVSDVVQDVGTAGAVDVSLGAGDLVTLNANYTRRDGNFRQLNDQPSYLTTDAASVSATTQLDKLLPSALGITAPLTVRYARSQSAPFYLNGTDLRGDALAGLRTPLNITQGYAFTVRRVRRSQHPLVRWLVDPVSLAGIATTGYSRSSLAAADARSSSVSFNYGVNPSSETVPAAPGFLVHVLQGIPLLKDLPFVRHLGSARLRVTPTALRFQSSLATSDASRFTFRIPVADTARTLPARSQTRVWRNTASLDLLPLSGVQLRMNLTSQRDLRDYGDSTTLGRLAHQQRRSLLGVDAGVESRRSLNTVLALTPRLNTWLRPRLTMTSTFTLNRDLNGRQPVREIGDSAGAFHLPTAFANSQRLDGGAQLDLGNLARSVFGDSAAASRWLARISGLEVTWSRVRTSTFSTVTGGGAPPLGFQLALSGFAGFRTQGGDLANAATQQHAFGAGGSADLPLGFRVTSRYNNTSAVTWALRNDTQVPLSSASRDWPVGTVSWSFTPPRWLSQVLTGVSAQVTGQVRTAATTQAGLEAGGAAVRSSSEDRSVSPGMSLTWAHGVLTSYDGSRQRSEQLSAGNLYRTSRDQQNFSLAFAWRPPAALLKMKGDIRTTGRYSTSSTLTCLRTVGASDCVPYVDSRQTSVQVTMDTSFPPSLSAGFQMAYVLNDERQINRKVSQLVLTAFVQFNATVGQSR